MRVFISPALFALLLGSPAFRAEETNSGGNFNATAVHAILCAARSDDEAYLQKRGGRPAISRFCSATYVNLQTVPRVGCEDALARGGFYYLVVAGLRDHVDACSPFSPVNSNHSQVPSSSFVGRAIVISDVGGCSLEQKLSNAAAADFGLVLLIMTHPGVLRPAGFIRYLQQSRLPVVLAPIGVDTRDRLSANSLDMVYICVPKTKHNLRWISVVTLFIISTTCCTFGAILSSRRTLEALNQPSCMERIHSSHQQQEPDDVSYFFVQSVLNNIICVLSKVWCQVVILVISVTGLLLFMYFFPVVMLYFAIGIFSLYGAWGVYRCASAGLRRGGCGRPEVRETCSGFLGILFPMTWLVTGLVDTPVWRWNWLIHVIIGACVCIDGVAQVRPTFKLVACTSVILLVYDVFFVFVSRLFTSDGVSIMEKVVLGAKIGSRSGVRTERCEYGVAGPSVRVFANTLGLPDSRGGIDFHLQPGRRRQCLWPASLLHARLWGRHRAWVLCSLLLPV